MIATRVSASTSADIVRGKSSILAVVAVSGVGLVTLTSGTAHAFPLAPADTPCDSWHLKSPVMTIDVGDPARSQISVDWDANSGVFPSTAEANASWNGPGGKGGNASGSGGPTTSVDLSFNWPNNPGNIPSLPAHFTGTIDPQFGSVNGKVSVIGGVQYDGVVSEHFECVHHAAAPAAPPAEANQAPAPDAQQAPHDAISLSYGQFGAEGLPVTVTNSSSVPGACTYDSTPLGFHQDFNVGANTSTTFDIAGLPTGTTYNVKVQCMGQFNGATVVIGGVNTTKKF